MQVRGIISAGAVRFAEVTGSASILSQDVVRFIADRYRFWAYPKGPGEFSIDDTSSGALFEGGIFGEMPIQRLRLYRRGVAVELTSGARTEDAEAFLDDLLTQGSRSLGVSYADGMPVRRAFHSVLEVQMSDGFSKHQNALSEVARLIDTAMSADGFSDTYYGFGSLTLIALDDSKPMRPNKFSIERRVGFQMNDNVYYSEAPLSTSAHVEVLEALDRIF